MSPRLARERLDTGADRARRRGRSQNGDGKGVTAVQQAQEPWQAGARGRSGPRQPRWKVTGAGQLAGPGQEERAHQVHSAHNLPLSRELVQKRVHKRRAVTPPENSEGPGQEDEAQRLKGAPWAQPCSSRTGSPGVACVHPPNTR